MNNGRVIKSYSEYQKLSREEKNLWDFEQLYAAGEFARTAHTRYASKWVERGAVTIITLIVVTIVGAILTQLI